MTTWTTDDEVDRSTQLTTSKVDGWTVKLSFLATKRDTTGPTSDALEVLENFNRRFSGVHLGFCQD